MKRKIYIFEWHRIAMQLRPGFLFGSHDTTACLPAGANSARWKTSLLPFLILLCLGWATSASAQYTPVVTGSDGCSTSGTYNYASDINGKPSFKFNGFSIFWENNKWNLAFVGDPPDIYYLCE